MSEEIVTIRLTRAEALVFFEFLSRFNVEEKLQVEDSAEERVLWNVHSSLEKTLTEPFQADYPELLKKARKQVTNKE
jgi:hypothetical protein